MASSFEVVKYDDIYTVNFHYPTLYQHKWYRGYILKIARKLTKHEKPSTSDLASTYRQLRDALYLVDQVKTIKVITGNAHSKFASLHVNDINFAVKLLVTIDNLICDEVSNFNYKRFSKVKSHQDVLKFLEKEISNSAKARIRSIIGNVSWFKDLLNIRDSMHFSGGVIRCGIKGKVVISFISSEAERSTNKNAFMRNIKRISNILIEHQLKYHMPDEWSKEVLSWLVDEGLKFYSGEVLMDIVRSEVNKYKDVKHSGYITKLLR